MAASNHYYMTRTLQRYQPQELWVLVECLASITVYSRISKEKKSKYVKMHFTIQISCQFHSWLHCVMLLLLLWEWALVSFITQLISKSCCQKAQTKQHLDATGETLNQSEQWSLWHNPSQSELNHTVCRDNMQSNCFLHNQGRVLLFWTFVLKVSKRCLLCQSS